MRRVALVLWVLALGALAACGGASKGDKATAASASASVDIKDFQFQAQTVTVKAGSTVTWTNRDGFAHSIKPENDSFTRSPAPLATGASYAFTFAKAGTYAYICGIHNSMTGTVIVT